MYFVNRGERSLRFRKKKKIKYNSPLADPTTLPFYNHIPVAAFIKLPKRTIN